MKLTLIAVAGLCCACALAPPAGAQAQSLSAVGSDFASDFRYIANNAEADPEDVVTSPLHISSLWADNGVLRQPRTYYTLLAAGAIFGGAMALDQTVRARLHTMSSSDANKLQDYGQWFVYGSGGLLYAYGFYAADQRAREDVITGMEGLGIASVLTTGLKDAFSRARPRQAHGAFHWFDHGDSFPSGHATPVFAAAAGISDYFDDRWYVAIPVYAGALTVGFGRIGHDAHWLSDIAGSALIGAGTTELLLYLHRRHAENPSRYRIFPVATPRTAALGVSVQW